MASPTSPTISATGITAPTFAEIQAYLKDQYRSIFGADTYLENDSQDGQFIGVLSAAINDSNAAAVACYNAFSPHTAQGVGLSSVIKINGIERLVSSASTVDVLIVGQVGTTITNGIVSDTNSNRWTLPASVLIPLAGSITVTATCTSSGAVAAPIGSVNKITTPTRGWQSVTNATAAVQGNPVETDAALRVRQSLSVAVPSVTIFEGIIGSVANLVGVTRIKGYENDTDTTDSNGIPGHTIAVIVEGGDALTIAQTIAEKKTPGTGTLGTITNQITDSVGSAHLIRFNRPTESAISVNITLTALTGWSTAILPYIKTALVNYLNALAIGQPVIYSKLYVPACLDNLGYSSTFNIEAMTIKKTGGAFAAADVAIAYNEVAFGLDANITITVV